MRAPLGASGAGGPVVTVRRRVAGGFALVLALFLTLIFVQLVVGDRLRSQHAAEIERIAQTRDVNRALLQYMTDAETGVRGFQLTGEVAFLDPYDRGREGALAAFEQLDDAIGDAELRRLLSVERNAAGSWLYAYAIPIINAGTADTDDVRAGRGKALFDRLRAAHAELDVALEQQQRATTGAHARESRRTDLLFGGLAALILLAALLLAALHQRQLMAPLEHIRLTLRRLAAGDLSARAVPAGPRELRAVIGTLNDLAAQTQRLLAAEQARAARGELRQAVAAELRGDGDLAEIAAGVAAKTAAALGATSVHTRLVVEHEDQVAVAWPAQTPPLAPETVHALRDAAAGTVLTPPGTDGALGVGLGDDTGPAGMICVLRADGREWTEDERRLLAAVAQEIDHAVGQRRLNRRHSRLISELRMLDAQKDVFVSTVTHELRTPLTSILGYTEMLADGEGGELSPVQRRGVAAILRNANRLHDTVGDLLVLDRANDRVDDRAGAGTSTVDLGALARQVYDELGPAARRKDVRGTLETVPALVHGDPDQLERALRNLIDNAIKFTPAGGRFACRLAADDDQVVVTVTDTGIGIPPDDLPGLFTPFHRAANAMHLAVQGTGLGLAIVRTIVTEHGGTVAARSVLGEGSTFTVTLPTRTLAGDD